MQIPQEALKLLGSKVSYCKSKPKEDGDTELFRGEGTITGIIIGATKRVQILVQDLSESKDKAWTLDPICINPTDEEAESYFAHHKKVKALVDEHNKAQKDREQEKMKELDELNYAFFGKPLEF